MSTPQAHVASLTPATLRVVARLAGLERPPGSEGEHAGAALLAEELAQRGASTRVEAERVHGTYWVPIGLCSLVAALGGLARRSVATAAGVAAALSIADDLQVGRRPLRRVLGQRTAHNVLAELPARGPGDRVLVIHAHHDAARTGIVFHPAAAKLTARLAGGLIERIGATPAPMWGAVHGPAAVCAGGLLGSRRLRLAGAALSAGYAARDGEHRLQPRRPRRQRQPLRRCRPARTGRAALAPTAAPTAGTTAQHRL
jgi:hypothetical protein